MCPFYDALPVPYVPVRVMCSGRTSVYLFDSSLRKLALPLELYSFLGVPVERFS